MHTWLLSSVMKYVCCFLLFFFFFQAEDGIRDYKVTGVQTCALPICLDFGIRDFRRLSTFPISGHPLAMVDGNNNSRHSSHSNDLARIPISAQAYSIDRKSVV